jgi:hypothetical protein
MPHDMRLPPPGDAVEDPAIIEARFRGPPGVGNGGYVAGTMAALLGRQPVEVTLRRGWPLDRPLRITREDGWVRALDAAGGLVAEARAATLDLQPPLPPSPAEAEAAARWFGATAFGRSHSDGACFVCGAARADGLRVFTGRVEGRPGLAAGLWRPASEFAAPDGLLRPEFLWAALDCAGSLAFALGEGPKRMLLGRMTGRLDGVVRTGEPCIVLGWRIGQEGRKCHAGTALFGEDGGLRGLALALWVTPPDPA